MSVAETGAAAKLERDPRGWYVAHHSNNDDIAIAVEETRESVRIQHCKRCILRVRGKCAAITVDRCEKLRLEFDSIISTVEVLNCNQIDLRPRESLKSVRVEKTESVVLYLNEHSIDCKIIHHLSYPVVVMVPEMETGGEGPAGPTHYQPITLDHQFESQWNGTKFVTKPSDY